MIGAGPETHVLPGQQLSEFSTQWSFNDCTAHASLSSSRTMLLGRSVI